ncbi:MAG: helix-turn-helix transcriptional regulator, partial [Clostridia bacterium]|nr:helix-turn-helix transcriptional regulator [Clostridia bacterium]
MTHEDLAEMLSISSQAVSRWETDAAMPDISLIAPLCSIFDISADELLGIDTANIEEKVHTICNEASSFSSRGYLDEACKILDDGLNRFPNHPKIIYELMYLSYMQYNACAERQRLDDAIVY